MSKTAKWIVGILVGLILVCGVVSAGFLTYSRFNGLAWVTAARAPRVLEGGRLLPRDIRPWDDMPMRPNRLAPFGFTRGIFPFRGLFGGLICLGFLFLIVLGIAALVASLSRSQKPAAAIATEAVSAPTSMQEETATPARACPNCQRPVSNDWSHCPYCGTALTPPS